MTDSMIEKVARALYDVGFARELLTPIDGVDGFNNLYREDKEKYLDDARAAIEALMEPTEEMLKPIGINSIGIQQDDFVERCVRDYQAMLRAALQQPDAAGE